MHTVNRTRVSQLAPTPAHYRPPTGRPLSSGTCTHLRLNELCAQCHHALLLAVERPALTLGAVQRGLQLALLALQSARLLHSWAGQGRSIQGLSTLGMLHGVAPCSWQ